MSGAATLRWLVPLCLLACGLAVVSMVRSCPRDPPPVVERYQCEAGHRWSAAASPSPACPECGEAGILDLSYRCAACRESFVAMQMQRVGTAEPRFRLAGETGWEREPAYELTCPHCRAHGSFEEGAFYPAKQEAPPTAAP